MPTTLTTFRDRLRIDLHDEDSNNYRWVNATLERHIARAVSDYSIACPIETVSTLTTTANSREVSLSTLTPLVDVVSAEWPTGYDPPRFVPFEVFADTLFIQGVDVPSSTQNIKIRWLKGHTVDGSGSTIPATHEDLITTGAAGFAAVEWGGYAVNRVNVGGDDTDRDYRTWGNAQLYFFRSQLRKLGYKGRLRTKTLRTAD